MCEDPQIFLLRGGRDGKTTILVYRFVHDIVTALDDNDDGWKKVLFVTHNTRLRNEVRRMLRWFIPEQHLENVKLNVVTVEELFRRILPTEQEERFNQQNRLTLVEFRRIFKGKAELDVDLFYEEYRGVLRGYNLHSNSHILTRDEYQQIGGKRGRVPSELRKIFYSEAEAFFENIQRDIQLQSKRERNVQKRAQSKKERKRESRKKPYSPQIASELWDDLDLCRAIYAVINSNAEHSTFDSVFIDEVQDLTKAELEIIIQLLHPNGPQRFAAAGDLAQSVEPSSFAEASEI